MRKRITLFAVLCTMVLLTLTCSATPAPAVVLSPDITVSDGSEIWMFGDNNRTTKRAFTDGGSLTLKNSDTTMITGLYLVWDAPAPERCTITVEGKEPIQTQGFLHEWINLADSTGDTITLTWEGSATLCDVVALGGSDTPDWVQLWRPAEGDCDILVLPTHADDEHLFLGGALATATSTPGCVVQVAYMVNHNGEYYRPHELLNGLWAIGVDRYPIIPDFPDVYSDSLAHAKTIYDEQEILDYQISLINRFRPQVIVGHDLNGEYGHGAHMLNAHTLTQAVEKAAEMPDGWNTPKLYLHLYKENPIVLNLDTPKTNDDVPREKLIGLTPFEIAQLGFSAHKSQQTFFSVEQSGPYDCRKLGLYRSAVGTDTQSDIFEHITLRANQPEPQPEPQSILTEVVPTDAPAPSRPPEKVQYLPEAQNDRLFAFVGSPLALTLALTGLLIAVLLYIIFRNRRV
ncbi:PIG-L deacetylase family protein [Oscillospiraceae bacterium LTW-04]|nr:PIG-L family deacetylase [Oscillospiraceae bacterium MB24-C1]